MIKQKPKKCKGAGKAVGYGCGNVKLLQKFGLCPDCFKSWLFSNNGLPYFNLIQLKAKRQTIIKKSIENKEKTIELLSADGYRQKYVQPIINEIARLIDYGQPCIATGSFNGKMAGGHFWSVGANRTICLNLHNIHIQSFHSNSALGGDNIRYREGIIKTYGIKYMEQIEALKLIKPIKLTKEQLIEVKKKATEIRNELKKGIEIFTPHERIWLRENINQKLGIYGRSNRKNQTD